MPAGRVALDPGLRSLGATRVLLGLLLLVRTTPLINGLGIPLAYMATPLLGWPEHGFRAAWLGLELPDVVVVGLCVVRTAAAAAFTVGVKTRAAGITAAVTAFLVLSQNAFDFSFTLYTLFVGVWLLSIGDAGSAFALWPSRSESASLASSRTLVHLFVASVYAWSAIAKLRTPWLTGTTLRTLYDAGFLTGPLSNLLFAGAGRCQGAAVGVVAVELALGPMLLAPRTRTLGLVTAASLHAAYESTAHPDIFGWIMCALLISFFPTRTKRGAP